MPTLIVIGAMKCGTRSVYEYLRNHPHVFMSTPKELNFFSRDDVWGRGVSWYASKFATDEAATARVRGEASPSYTMAQRSPATAERMHALLPEARLLCLVRQPVDRIESHYQHRIRKNHSLLPIDEEVLTNPEYVQTSAYATQLAPYVDLYRTDQLLVVQSESLRSDRLATMQQIYRFAGVDPQIDPSLLQEEYSRADTMRVPRSELRRVRRSRSVRRLVRHMPRPLRRRVASLTTVVSNAPDHRLSPETRSILTAQLVDEVRRLRPLMAPDFDGWGLA